ncbi:methylase [Rhodococcus ruber Chol-4]|uniref:class I SAM-dependent methyltransferase n=1 Tax=Rhodococcus TaxID=1827 RepID=UPI00029B1FDA|nr:MULTISPECIES: class I SAM-dependent methyltransferase [Rhodococcus]MDO2381278.1 class I SAM-dependent methyltransferase [Rhodococcus ruber]MDX5311059.1 class I SAM-dependent methyltransferase [Rhodococcus sp. (in: high G+C Gram-positive bacteria)]RIK09135.1 MAG: class I SAM-dependent methyltransferase [Acidobacteriota bacterium]ATQ30847.1 class I SAM-dependent methyltransferase [Rhodococcus ruber]AWG97790.1 class I SAM-dependent methyltransferase [Rhodococcus ruber]
MTTGAARARDYDTWFDTPWGAHAWAVERDAVDEVLPDVAGRTVVEVGCGTGRLVSHLAHRGARMLGVDLAAGMLSVATDRAPARLVRADATRLPVPDAVADAAVTIATLEFTDAAAVLVEMARITRPGGRIVALTLNPTSPWGWIDRPTRRAPYSAARYVSRRELRRLGGRHGRAQVRGRLFTAARFGHRLEPIAALPGRIVPWFGAVQMLVVDREL